jgi:flavodoxin
MSNVLVVSYSLGGTTRVVADEIATALSADTHEIQEARKRSGMMQYFLAGLESLAKGLPAIRSDCDPGGYELVVLGTPVWAGSMASPMRSFLFSNHGKINNVACFCTMGGRGAEGTLQEMQLLSGAEKAISYSAREADVHNGAYRPGLEEFIAALKRASEGAVTAVA